MVISAAVECLVRIKDKWKTSTIPRSNHQRLHFWHQQVRSILNVLMWWTRPSKSQQSIDKTLVNSDFAMYLIRWIFVTMYLFALVYGANLEEQRDDEETLWATFKQTHGKQYADDNEDNYRFVINYYIQISIVVETAFQYGLTSSSVAKNGLCSPLQFTHYFSSLSLYNCHPSVPLAFFPSPLLPSLLSLHQE